MFGQLPLPVDIAAIAYDSSKVVGDFYCYFTTFERLTFGKIDGFDCRRHCVEPDSKSAEGARRGPKEHSVVSCGQCADVFAVDADDGEFVRQVVRQRGGRGYCHVKALVGRQLMAFEGEVVLLRKPGRVL